MSDERINQSIREIEFIRSELIKSGETVKERDATIKQLQEAVAGFDVHIDKLDEENQRLTARLQRQAETIDDFQKGLGKFINHPTGAIPHFGYAEKYLNDMKAENQRVKSSMKTLLLGWKRGDSYEFYEDLIEKHKLIGL